LCFWVQINAQKLNGQGADEFLPGHYELCFSKDYFLAVSRGQSYINATKLYP